MYAVDNLDTLWHPEITPINGLPDIAPDSIGTQYINGAICDRLIAARFVQPERNEIEWLMQRPRGQNGTGRVVFAWVPMDQVQYLDAG